MKTFMLVGLLTVSLILYLGLKWLWDNIEVKGDDPKPPIGKEDRDS